MPLSKIISESVDLSDNFNFTGTLQQNGAGICGDNKPAFYSELSSNQVIGDAGDVKVQFNTEILDTDNAYDNSSNYRFTVPSGEGGKYFIFTGLTIYGTVVYSVFDCYL